MGHCECHTNWDCGQRTQRFADLIGRTFRSTAGNLWRVEAVTDETVRVHRVHDDGRYMDDPVSGGYWWHWQSIYALDMTEVV
jgi:hypothetical protein